MSYFFSLERAIKVLFIKCMYLISLPLLDFSFVVKPDLISVQWYNKKKKV